MGATTLKMGMGAAAMRVKERLIFVYLFSEYRDEDTAVWLRQAIERWVDSILAANR